MNMWVPSAPPFNPSTGPTNAIAVRKRLIEPGGARTPANGHLCGGAGAYPRHHD